ncbi:MAG: RHS repeat-associated core domain-containing protein [Oculatellaceae cyanobacterium bins.114]|nr:RHS repeat-associated core domain-containing protein [Oculatellaceae cyanobacterium bins.114]
MSSYATGTEQTAYTWNDENRLVGVQTAAGDVLSYVYNSEGIRTSSTTNRATTEYLVDANRDYAQVLEERVNGNLIVSYIYGRDLISQERSNVTSFYLVDGLGSTTALTDVSGNITDTYTYDAYGRAVSETGSTQNSYQFAGEQFDENLDEYYLRDRYYNTNVGRFTRRDSYPGHISNPLTLHKYVYGNINPVNQIDPSGLSSITASESSCTNLMLNILNNIGASISTVANPTSIQLAKAWGILLAAGIGTISFLVLKEMQSDGAIEYKILPDAEPEPQRRREPTSPTTFQDMNQMRVQAQDAPGNTLGVPMYNVPEVGVTLSQVYQGVGILWQQRDAISGWLPRSYDTAFIKGMAYVTQAAQDIQENGGTSGRGGEQLATYQWDRNDEKGNRAKAARGSLRFGDRKYYRIDFENLRGRNLIS